MAQNLREARAIATTIIEHPPVVEPVRPFGSTAIV
jgi:hypothetical protein